MTPNSLETKVAVMQNQIKNVEQKVDEGFDSAKTEMAKLNKKMDDFIATANASFASKWVEDDLIWLRRMVIGAVVMAILGIVFVNK